MDIYFKIPIDLTQVISRSNFVIKIYLSNIDTYIEKIRFKEGVNVKIRCRTVNGFFIVEFIKSYTEKFNIKLNGNYDIKFTCQHPYKFITSNSMKQVNNEIEKIYMAIRNFFQNIIQYHEKALDIK